MEFLSLSRKRSSARNAHSGEEGGETDVPQANDEDDDDNLETLRIKGEM